MRSDAEGVKRGICAGPYGRGCCIDRRFGDTLVLETAAPTSPQPVRCGNANLDTDHLLVVRRVGSPHNASPTRVR